ncbi:MAG: NgoBV family restriction endonuclease [Bacteroidetes bacterium]|nr:NgoBV family restriction endonuclease [Bacteroidota bacterium]HET6244820.1 NgoBV family restriction endonuclease [Bacteroidia bacterium]
MKIEYLCKLSIKVFMKLTAQELYHKLVYEYKIIGEKAVINFSLKDLTISVETKDTVGNLLQEWLKAWMKKENIEFEENVNSQVFPDFYLNKGNLKKGLLEVKSFDWDRGPGFDLANFDSYCNSLLENTYRIDSDYLIFAYQMSGSVITIKDVWVKKIWELACPSGTYPIKVQEKKNVIYNLRPSTWYSERTKFKPFASKEEFLAALNETRYKYPQTRHANGHWLQKVLKNYHEHTGVLLTVE